MARRAAPKKKTAARKDGLMQPKLTTPQKRRLEAIDGNNTPRNSKRIRVIFEPYQTPQPSKLSKHTSSKSVSTSAIRNKKISKVKRVLFKELNAKSKSIKRPVAKKTAMTKKPIPSRPVASVKSTTAKGVKNEKAHAKVTKGNTPNKKVGVPKLNKKKGNLKKVQKPEKVSKKSKIVSKRNAKKSKDSEGIAEDAMGKENKKKKTKNLKDSENATDKTEIPQKKQRKGKFALNPKPFVTQYDVDPTFESNTTIPHVSTLAHSRLIMRAVFRNDESLVKALLKPPQKLISTILCPRSICDPRNAFDFAVEKENISMIKALMGKETKQFGPYPSVLLESETSGFGNRRMFGHALRAVTVARGGKEGNNAFLKDIHHYNQDVCSMHVNNLIPHALTVGVKVSILEKMSTLQKDDNDGNWFWSNVSDNILHAIQGGHCELAGELVKRAIKRGGFGFNQLHEQVLSHVNEPLSAFKAVSVVKKAQDNSRITPLHCAAINPNPKYLSALLTVRPEYGIMDTGNWTLVHYAAVCTGDGPLKLLLSRGVPVMQINKVGNTPLHLAASLGRVHNAKLLIQHEVDNKDKADEDDDGDEVVSHKHATGTMMDKVNKAGQTPLHCAAAMGHVEIIEMLISAGADPNKPTPAQHDKLTPCMVAAQFGHLEVVKCFVGRGVKLEVGDRRGRTALTHAVMCGQGHIVSYLLRLGANHLTKDSSGNTLILYAAAYGWYFILKLLIEAGCSPSEGNHWKMTPLAIAFMKGHIGLVDFLVTLPGIDINAPIDDTNGMTMVLQACASQPDQTYLSRLNYLIDTQKASCKVVDYNKNSAMHYLVETEAKYQHLYPDNKEYSQKHLFETALFLIQNGCDANSPNADDVTPFELAVEKGCFKLAQRFLDYGLLIPTKQNSMGNTFLHSLVPHILEPDATKLYEMCNSKQAPHRRSLLVDMVNQYNKAGCTPLLDTLQKYHQHTKDSERITSFVKFLSGLGADMNAKVVIKEEKGEETTTRSGDSVLHLSASSTFVKDILPLVLAKRPAVDVLNAQNRTPLTETVISGNLDAAKQLLKAGANVNFKSVKDSGDSILVIAAQRQHISFEMISLLVDNGANVHDLNQETENSVLHYVACKPTLPHTLEAIQKLIKAGVDINKKNKLGRTAMHLAVNARGGETDVSYDVEEALISAGTDLTIKDVRGRIPLHYAFVKIRAYAQKTFMDPIELVALLVSGLKNKHDGLKGVALPDEFGMTPLHYAAFRGATISSSLIITHWKQLKANIDCPDKKGNTPFGLSVLNGHEGCSLHFQQHGANATLAVNLNEYKNITEDEDNKNESSVGTTFESCNGKVSNKQRKRRNSGSSNSSGSESEAESDTESESSSKSNLQVRTPSAVAANGQPARPEEERWKWKLVQNEEELSKKREEIRKVHSILQEVVCKNWQGILYLVVESLKEAGQGVIPAIEAAIKTTRPNLALKLIKLSRSEDLIMSNENLLHMLTKVPAYNDKDIDLVKKIVEALVSKGVGLTSLDDVGSTPLIYSAVNWHEQIGKLIVKLIPSGAPLNPDKYGRTPFSALFWRDLGKMNNGTRQSLIQLGNYIDSYFEPEEDYVGCQYPIKLAPFPGVRYIYDELNMVPKGMKYPPLIICVIYGDYDAVKWLLSLRSLDVNCRDEQGRTALMHAVRLNDAKMTRLLLDPHQYNAKESKWAASFNGKDSQSKQNVSIRDKNGWTVVDHWVCPMDSKQYYYVNNSEIFKILVKVKASFDGGIGRNWSQPTPIQKAIELKRFHTVRQLEDVLKVPFNSRQPALEKVEKFPAYGVDGVQLPAIEDFKDDARKMMDHLESKYTNEEVVVPVDKLVSSEDPSYKVMMDPDQNIPFDCVLTKVDVSYGIYGLYNFYKMQLVKQSKGKELIVLFTRWGRVGDVGQYQRTPFVTEEEAIKEFKKIFRSKSGNQWEDVQRFVPAPKRYRLVKIAFNKGRKSNKIKVDFNAIQKSFENRPSRLSAPLKTLMKNLCLVHKRESTFIAGLAAEYLHDLPFGLLTADGLQEGVNILDQIKAIVKEKDAYIKQPAYDATKYENFMEQIVSLSEEFYTQIPIFDFSAEKLGPLFSKEDLRSKEQALYSLIHLKFASYVLLGAQFNLSTGHNPIDYAYQCLPTTLQLLQKDSEEAQIILQCIHNNSENNVSPLEIYSVSRKDEETRMESTGINNRWMLWHGTRAVNILSILHGGLQPAPLGVRLTGHLFGKGIYFADVFGKSNNYTDPDHEGNRYMFFCEVALGNSHPVGLSYAAVQAEHNKPIPANCHSLKTSDSRYCPNPEHTISWRGRNIPLGRQVDQQHGPNIQFGLYYDEYIVFNPDQVALRYLIKY